MSVCALVVTHNRFELLRECLQAVFGQTRGVDEVIVVDNASTDGTPERVAAEFPQATVVSLERNEGGAGGFHEGMRYAVQRGFDWLWVMDDDTVPTPQALERLLEARDGLDGLPSPSMLASKVLWSDGSMHPMNHPGANLLDMDVVARGLELGALPIRWSTFPSLLVSRGAIERHGLPRKGFFIWSDDIDFTARILRHEPGYLVASSVAYHNTPTPQQPWQGGERFYYAVRNSLFILRGPALRPKERVSFSLLVAEQTRRFLLHNRFRPGAIGVVLRGLRDGLLRRAP
jgi:rhamnopyranosyl-N-acetylglucosaminyl-diphospho-decaprenol beta-1,3/1,4-galactofuranosyltransferase